MLGLFSICFLSRPDVNGNLKLTPFTLKQQSKIDPFDLVLSFNLGLNPNSFFILQTITLTRYLYHMTVM